MSTRCRSDVGALGRGLRLGLDVLGRLPNHVTDADDDADEEHKAAKGAEGDANDGAIRQPVVGGRHDLRIRGTGGGCGEARAVAHRAHVGIRERRVARLGGRADQSHSQGRRAGALVADGAVDCCARPLCLVAPRARARAAVAGTAARAEEGLHHLAGFETEEAAVGGYGLLRGGCGGQWRL
eukprot:scaffold13341_cov65-Phaeocystis_antarctica.AAC.1